METKKRFGLLLLFYLIIIITAFGFWSYKTRDRIEYCRDDVCQDKEIIDYNQTKLEHYRGIELISLEYDQNTTEWLFDKAKAVDDSYLIDLKQIIFINETVIEWTNNKRYSVGGYYPSAEAHIVIYKKPYPQEDDIEKSLCHEIAHNLIGIKSKELVIHSMVHFLGQEKFCYEKAIVVERGF